ncbi:MAG TPA: hypothetical protein VF384_10960 [Planctomycetota bacterium]
MTDEYFPCLDHMGLTVGQAIGYCSRIGNWQLQKHTGGGHVPFIDEELDLPVKNCEDYPPGALLPTGGSVGAELENPQDAAARRPGVDEP